MLKRELIKCIQTFAEVTNIKIIAEGIETYDELKTLIDFGIEYGQGYYIQRPNPLFINLNEGITETIVQINHTKTSCKDNSLALKIVNYYLRMDVPIELYDVGYSAHEVFMANNNLQGIAVVNNKKVAGLIMRGKFYQKLPANKSKELLYRRSLKELMDNNPLVVDAEELLTDVCRRALSRDEDRVYDYIIIKENGYYKGVIPFGGLMDALLCVL